MRFAMQTLFMGFDVDVGDDNGQTSKALKVRTSVDQK